MDHTASPLAAELEASGCSNGSQPVAAPRSAAQQKELHPELRRPSPACSSANTSPTSASSSSTTTNTTTSSTSSSSSSSSSSEPQYSEDVLRNVAPMLNLLPRQGSGSSTKTCEVDVGDEERDTFSPVSGSASVSPGAGAGAVGGGVGGICNGTEAASPGAVAANMDNKIYDGSTSLKCHNKLSGGNPAMGAGGGGGLILTATKEEKQRQNEEIVIMETSSISSETGSWESVFPHATASAAATAAAAPTDALPRLTPVVGVSVTAASVAANNSSTSSALLSCCSDFLQNERKVQQVLLDKPKEKDKRERDCDEYPAAAALGLFKEPPLSPYLARERTYSAGGGGTLTADTSSLFGGGTTSPLLRDLDRCENALTASGTSACFIDASSLRDEDEVLSFPSLDGQQSNDDWLDERHDDNSDEDELAADDRAPERGANVAKPLNGLQASDESPTKKLETFHKAFAKCKVKSSKELHDGMDSPAKSHSSSSSNSGIESPQKGICESAASASSMNNLSDEEKLWKREHDNTQPKVTAMPQRDNYEKDSLQQQQEDATEASVSLAADADSSDSSDIVMKLRREQERKLNGSAEQNTATAGIPIGGGGGGSSSGPSYVFHHNMQQFSIHPLTASPKFNATHGAAQTGAAHTHGGAHTTATAGHSDLSYTTDYSSSSPAPSLVWSEHEHRSSARHHHGDDYEGGNVNSNGSGSGSALHKSVASMLPETPHNSIVHIENVSSNTSSIHRDYTLSSSFSHQRDSGAYCSDATDSPVPMPRTPKRSKFDEANPILSGGVSIRDFNPKKCESPPVKRKTDTCPIVSGGFVSLDFEPTCPVDDEDDDDDDDDDDDGAEVELRAKPMTRKPISGIASWVVDMSDCRRERRKSATSSTSSLEAATPASVARCRERSDSTSSHKSGCGFYVSLDDMDKKPDDPTATKATMSKSYTTAPKSVGYTVNLSQSEYKPKEPPREPAGPAASSDDKKNIFSMFIDFGSGGEKSKSSSGSSVRREPFSLAQRLTSSSGASGANRRPADDPMKSSASSTETLMSKSSSAFKTLNDNENTGSGESKSLDYRCNLDAPVTVAAIRRISQQQRVQADASKRHSWSNNNSSQVKDNPTVATDYKRSISLTAGKDSKDIAGGGGGLMSIIDKLPIISKASSLSVDSSLSPYDEYMGGSKSELSTSSNNSARNSMSGGERDDVGNNAASAGRLKKRRRDVQINETFDKSSLASITDGILSKDMSPASTTTDTDDLTFQQDEELAIREAALQPLQAIASSRSSAIIMETIIETKETSSPKKNATGHTMETLHATIEKQKMLLETVNEHAEVGGGGEKCSFVKLSDMDKPVKFELQSPDTTMMSKSAGNHRQINRLFRDESKMRPHSWTMTRSTGNSFLNITNSVDNLRSLSRLFPNFSKEFSNSVPNDMVLDNMDYIQTDLSADSSLASSFSRSGMDESSMSCRQPRRLGEDLLKMFLQEIATDMVVEVQSRRIKAHKCILRSRCQYFAAMLAGTGSQSVVALQGYSYPAVHFALCHIYSGASHPPDGISLMELAALADLLGLEGLKEVTAHALRTNYCHNFHKPCSGCIDGILQVLPVALNHALDDLYRKCLRWTCRHYLKVWPTRQFSQLPPDIHGRCRQQIVAYLTSESVLDTVLDCDDMLGQLAAYRWGGICENLVRDILDAAYAYVADHFASLIASDSFLLLGHDRSCHIPRLEGLILRTASSLTPDQACRSYQRVTRLNTVLQAKIIQMPANLGELAKELQNLQEEDLDWDPEYIRLVSAILSAVEQCLTRQCSRAMRVTAWQRMDLELRKKIQTLARLTEPLDMKRSKPVSKAFTFSGSTRNQDLYQVKLAIQAHSKRALAQDTQLYKATQTQETAGGGNAAVQTVERGVQANNDLREGNSKLLKSNSRAYVPSGHHRASSQSAATSERNSLSTNHHRRTQSEVPVPVAATKAPAAATQLAKSEQTPVASAQAKQKGVGGPRLSEVRPRYLEPRKVHNGSSSGASSAAVGPVRSATTTSIPAARGKAHNQHHHHLSSSDSSRNSSPAAARKLATSNVPNANAVKIGTKSTNMSLDSLASPRRITKGGRGKCSDNERYASDVGGCGGDSLTGSMKSSMITNKTVSHESLNSTATSKLSRSNPLIGNNRYAAGTLQSATKAAPGGPSRPVKRGASVGARPPKHLQQHSGGGGGTQHIKSTGSSPSSVNTTKSATSRLSSVSSTHSSRDLFKHRSISVPAAPGAGTGTAGDTATQRHSFLSAKSREILAKRAEKNKQQQQQLSSSNTANMNGDDKTNNGNGNGSTTTTLTITTITGPMRSASHSSVTAAMNAHNRNSLPSNIPMRRPNTLMLKTPKPFGKLNSNGNQVLAVAKTTKAANVTNGVLKAAHAVRHKLEMLIDQTNTINTDDPTPPPPTAMVVGGAMDAPPAMRVESKLERSSTFCKESSDLDMNELQIIE